MAERGQFTFYRSFWEAVKSLPKKDKLPILEAIISYALDGAEPSCLSQSQLAFFLLVKPTLDSSRKKAANGKQGGSKPKANSKQTPSEKEKEEENEEEKEKEIEIEGEKEKEQSASAPHSGKPFTTFWDAYPKKIDRSGAWEVWKALNPSEELSRQIISSLDAWCKSSQWTDDGGRYIPDAAKFLTKGYWRTTPPPPKMDKTPKGASGELGEAELEAIRQVLSQEVQP